MKLCLVCHLNFTDEQSVCPKDNAQLVPLGTDPLIGKVIQDRYKIETIIGKGSMGMVYKANQELIGREVAVKVLHSHLVADNESLKRFHQQAKAASRLNHPHIITLFDYGVISGGQPYIVMDLLQGKSLAKLLEEQRCLSIEETLSIFRQICEALSDAHKHGVVHRDVKPDNIVLEDGGNQKYFVKVVDFGIAKLIQGSDETQQRITRTGTVCGSPAYMSPEQFHGHDVDQRSDIYSLGAVLCESLTGRLPFTAPDLITLMSLHVSEAPPRLSELRPDMKFPPALEKMVERALAKNPDHRQSTMDDFWDELQSACLEKKGKDRSAITLEDIPVPKLSSAAGTAVEAMQAVVASHLAKGSKSPEITESHGQTTGKGVTQRQPTTQPVPVSAAQLNTQRLTKARTPIPPHIKLIGLTQRISPYLFALGLTAVLGFVVTNDQRVSSIVDKIIAPLSRKPDTTAGSKSAKALFDKGKFEEARLSLEKRKKSLSPSELDLLNRVYIRLSEKEAKAKRYHNAVRLLQQVSTKGPQAAKAKFLIRRYKRLAG